MGNLNAYSDRVLQKVRDEAIESINSKRAVIDYKTDWLENLFKNTKNHNMITMKNVVVPKDGEITFLAEPKNFYDIFKRAKGVEEANEVFRKFLNEENNKYVQKFSYNYSDRDLWFNNTLKGINMRPGYIRVGTTYNVEQCRPILLGDDIVHSKVAGRTGGGKSVLLNDIICTMMYEYAPWWLDIWLADFKLVEMSRYGNKIPAPHVSVIAATEMMEYVVSCMYELYTRMKVRQDFFTKLGVQKLADFYKKYKVILPQTVLITDEFQQMFELATSKQAQVIEKLIKMITKLGRATGFHLVFASQSMSGTVSGDILSNFKAGIALPCDDSVSSTIIGNGEAKTLKGKGKCIVNEGSGALEENIGYAVPFLNSDEDADGDSDLYKILREHRELTDKVGFKRNLKFYSDDYVRPLKCLDEVMKDIMENTKKAKQSSFELDDILALGDTALYKEGKDLEIVPIKKGDKQNIILCGDVVEQRAYMLKLLATQWKYKESKNFLLNMDVGLGKIYDIEEDLNFQNTFVKKLPLGVINSDLNVRKALYEFNMQKDKTDIEFIKFLLETNVINGFEYFFENGATKNEVSKVEDLLYAIIQMVQMKEYSEDIVCNTLEGIDYLKEDYSNDRKKEKMITDSIKIFKLFGFYYTELKKCFEGEELVEDRLPTLTFWVLGADKCEDLMEEGNRLYTEYEKVLKICTNYKIRFILCCSDIKEIQSVAKMCSHLIIKSENEKNYTLMRMDKKSYDEQYYRYKNFYESVNKFKAGLEVIPNEEKLFKNYDFLFEEKEEVDFLSGIEY